MDKSYQSRSFTDFPLLLGQLHNGDGGGGWAELLPLFDPSLSPRNTALVACVDGAERGATCWRAYPRRQC